MFYFDSEKEENKVKEMLEIKPDEINNKNTKHS